MKKAEHIDRLRDSSILLIECNFCEETSQADSAYAFFSEGWRYGYSKEYEAIGIMCPECAKKAIREQIRGILKKAKK